MYAVRSHTTGLISLPPQLRLLIHASDGPKETYRLARDSDGRWARAWWLSRK